MDSTLQGIRRRIQCRRLVFGLFPVLGFNSKGDPMFSKTTRFEILLEAAPDAHGLDLELSGRHRDRTEFPANISMSHIDTGNVSWDHGGA